jgi:hypothetical protein
MEKEVQLSNPGVTSLQSFILENFVDPQLLSKCSATADRMQQWLIPPILCTLTTENNSRTALMRSCIGTHPEQIFYVLLSSEAISKIHAVDSKESIK